MRPSTYTVDFSRAGLRGSRVVAELESGADGIAVFELWTVQPIAMRSDLSIPSDVLRLSTQLLTTSSTRCFLNGRAES